MKAGGVDPDMPLPTEMQGAPAPQAKPEAPEKDTMDLLAEAYPNFPSRQQIDAWKEEYGNVIAYVPNDDEVYLLRALRRFEHTQISVEMHGLMQGEAAKSDPDLVQRTIEDRVVTRCMLHPRLSSEQKRFAPFGLFSALHGAVMELSHAITLERVMQATVKL